jgi:outer membrane protein OmpA-like peptidoglycan-associated protein
MLKNRIAGLVRLVSVSAIIVGLAGCTGGLKKDMTALEGRVEQVDATANRAAADAQEALDLAASGNQQAQEALLQAELAREIALGNVRHDVVRKVVVHFGFDSTRLNDQAMQDLDQVADDVRANPNYLALISGHTDSSGDDQYNVVLAQRRAAAVRQYLGERLGSDFVRLASIGLGELQPAADNGTADGRRQNRRVEILIVIPVPVTVGS